MCFFCGFWGTSTCNVNFKKTGNWYHRQPLGKNILGNFLPLMCKAAGIKTKYTNHFTRVTTSTLLNEAGFGENDIIKVTGYKSTTTLSNYPNKASRAKKNNKKWQIL